MSHVQTGTLIDGLASARARLVASTPWTDPSFHAIFELLAWAGAVRDRFRDERRDIPAVLNGLWYVRNIVLHQGADILYWIMTPGSVARASNTSRITLPV